MSRFVYHVKCKYNMITQGLREKKKHMDILYVYTRVCIGYVKGK